MGVFGIRAWHTAIWRAWPLRRRRDGRQNLFPQELKVSQDLGIGNNAVFRLRDVVEADRRKYWKKRARSIARRYLRQNVLYAFSIFVVCPTWVSPFSDGLEKFYFFIPYSFFVIKSDAGINYNAFRSREELIVDVEQ